jgi:hypothetical protein
MSEETNPPNESRPAIFLIKEDNNARPMSANNLRHLGHSLLVAEGRSKC